MKRLCRMFILGLASLLVMASGVARADYNFFAELSGQREIPPNDSQGYGFALVTVNDQFDTLSVELYWEGLGTNASSASICLWDHDQLGPEFFWWRPPIFPWGIDMISLTEKDLLASSGVTMYDVVVALFQGQLYLNLHSEKFPNGEIGGAIFPYGD